ncbi:Pfs, NB-ARC and TPR domain protein [Fonsecaea pedrosoi]|nr:Pfs, NB-ARC and TPR domain protein [Fonsecaea pedrosoi]
MPSLPIEEYQVGWVCALPKELTAARVMLDEEHEPYSNQVPHDNNNYVLGRIHGHNVVMACLPAGVYGTVSAATVATNMLRTFTGIRFGLMVGIGGGIPGSHKGGDIRLGDVVVSQPDGTHGGVVQYDLRTNLGDGVFEQKGMLRPPPTLLLTALANLQSKHQMYGSQIPEILSAMVQRFPRLAKGGYVHPGVENDTLFCSNIEGHQDGGHCTECQNGIVDRQPREDHSPEVHYGVIASGNELMKNVVERARLGREFGAKCVEMEAAGLMPDFPCVVVRGICDYADSHTNDVWQEYAAATAAGFAKELLAIVKPAEVMSVKQAAEVMKYNLGLNLYDAPDMNEDFFIGRQSEIHRMESILQPQSDTVDSRRKVLVLGGMGGIGKTQLAISYAKRHRSDYSSVFWLNATSEVSLQTSLRNVAHRVLPPETVGKLDGEQIRVSISNWLSEHDNTRWLLIFDNYDDPDEYSLHTYFSYVAQGSVIVTTRQPGRVNGVEVRVQSMSKEDDSLRILATRSGRDNAESDQDARLLAQRLEGHPLALATAGAFLSQSSISFGQYLRQYHARWKVIDSMEALPEYPSRTLYMTWTLSFTRIEQQCPRAAHLLRFLAYLDHQDVWFQLFTRVQGDNRPAWFTELAGDECVFEDTMHILTRYCLVEAHYQTGSYSLHVCVHDWTLEGLNQPIDARQYWLAFDCVASHVDKDENWDHLSTIRYRPITRHAERLVHGRFRTAANRNDSVRIRLDAMVLLAQLLRYQVRFNAAEQMYIQALQGYEEALGPDHISTLDTVNDLGGLYNVQGKLVEAEKMFVRALQGFEKVLGPDYILTLDTVNNLGLFYNAHGKLVEAEKMFVRALQGFKKALGPDHILTLNTVNNLGRLYIAQGKLVEAEKMCVRALQGFKKALGPDYISTLDTVNNLGLLYIAQDKLVEAEKMFVRALQGCEEILGPDHISTLHTVNNLGLLYTAQDKLVEAEKMCVRALQGCEEVLGPDHLSTLYAVGSLGLLYNAQGKLVEAEKMYVRALQGYEEAFGVERVSSYLPALSTIFSFGNLYAQTDRTDTAKEMYTRALSGYAAVQGPSSKRCIEIQDRLQALQLTPSESDTQHTPTESGNTEQNLVYRNFSTDQEDD